MTAIGFIAGVLTIGGTVMQAVTSLRDFSRTEQEIVGAADAIDELRAEVKWWHLVQWIRHRRQVSQLLKESSSEYLAWKTVQWRLRSWSVLVVATIASFVAYLGG